MRPILVALVTLAVGGAAREAHAETGEPFDGTTVAVQSAAGLATMFGFGAVGIYFTDRCELAWCEPNARPLFVGLGTGILTTLVSVHLIGDHAFDGTGSFGGTALGTLGGVAVGVIATVVASKRGAESGPPLLTAFALPVVAGVVIGYHASADAKVVSVPLLGGAF